MVGKWELSKPQFICLQYKGRCASACLVRPLACLRAVGEVWRSDLNISTNITLLGLLLIIRLQQHKQALPGEKCLEPGEGMYSISSNKGRYAGQPSWIARLRTNIISTASSRYFEIATVQEGLKIGNVLKHIAPSPGH